MDSTSQHPFVNAPGAPGVTPSWCRSAKDTVGCALGTSRLWFTMGHGIINEVYYPRIDIPQIRDLGFIVADGKGFWVEVKRLRDRDLVTAAAGVPAVSVVHRHPRFSLSLRVTPDPQRDVLLVEVVLSGEPGLRPYALLAPHLGGSGYHNRAWASRYRGRRVLLAEQGPFGLALAAVDADQQDAFDRTSAGFVGVSDGWRDFSQNGAMHWTHEFAGPGNVALMGRLPTRAVLALAIGSSKEAAATLALSAMCRSFDEPWQRHIDAWEDWHAGCNARCQLNVILPDPLRRQLRISAMVLRVHQDQTYPGAMVASLSIPWGHTRDERGGYHLVWPRDLVECASGLLALGADDKAREILRYLIATQYDDGRWNQNQWLGGKPFWEGIQLDEVAYPVLLAAKLAERDALNEIEITGMIRRALSFIVLHGPSSEQDRWEENTGVNNFTLAVCIAALVAGARFLSGADAEAALAIADFWNSRIEDWTSVQATALAKRCGVKGYYVRTAPPRAITDEEALNETLPVKNRLQDPGLKAEEQISTGFLQLVRYGLRKADDPLVSATTKVVDSLLRIETPNGPCWYRYNGDGYGEHTDGSPFDGTGRGRAWPLLTGERGHYELMLGKSPLPCLEAMTAMCSPGGMIPEQVWDSAPLPEYHLFPGQPTGSAMPLAWAHAEFIKLVCSWGLKRPFDRLASVWERYRGNRPRAPLCTWSPSAPVDTLEPGQLLQICLPRPANIRWHAASNGDATTVGTSPGGLGLHMARIDTRQLATGNTLRFSVRYEGEIHDSVRHAVDVKPVRA